jgi:hypothetical protein
MRLPLCCESEDIGAVLTGAKAHDSQVAIPLMTMSAQRVTYCYD